MKWWILRYYYPEISRIFETACELNSCLKEVCLQSFVRFSDRVKIESKVEKICFEFKEWEMVHQKFLLFGEDDEGVPLMFLENMNQQIDSFYRFMYDVERFEWCLGRMFLDCGEVKNFHLKLEKFLSFLENGSE